jgi:hypothetical protein
VKPKRRVAGVAHTRSAFRAPFRVAFLWIRDNEAPGAGATLWKTPGSDGGDSSGNP